MNQNKINFLRQAISLLLIDNAITYRSQGKPPVFVIQVTQKSSLDMTYADQGGNLSPLLKIFNLLGQCQAQFSASPVFGDHHRFEYFVIQVSDIVPVWDSSKYTGKFKGLS
ncbi:hypothetical protein [Lentilactobacillus kisonensis]|uniref:Uncharacterized protein n=1 Tax=Lentilactobacillus kisonensis F0435 TaxID=797516 RepID=H1LHJ4_9LACO|nr:hypothetical protein [Lentilactobacillus kisonensis]EHO50320.1 hypothetical protein HMPREF9104_02085 [Lentilactobacillus kisonensis F0435]